MSHNASCDARGCCEFLMIRIQAHGVDRLPIAHGPAPAFGRAVARVRGDFELPFDASAARAFGQVAGSLRRFGRMTTAS